MEIDTFKHRSHLAVEAFTLNVIYAKTMLLYSTVIPHVAGVKFNHYVLLSFIHVTIMAIWISVCCLVLVTVKEKFNFHVVSGLI